MELEIKLAPFFGYNMGKVQDFLWSLDQFGLVPAGVAFNLTPEDTEKIAKILGD